MSDQARPTADEIARQKRIMAAAVSRAQELVGKSAANDLVQEAFVNAAESPARTQEDDETRRIIRAVEETATKRRQDRCTRHAVRLVDDVPQLAQTFRHATDAEVFSRAIADGDRKAARLLRRASHPRNSEDAARGRAAVRDYGRTLRKTGGHTLLPVRAAAAETRNRRPWSRARAALDWEEPFVVQVAGETVMVYRAFSTAWPAIRLCPSAWLREHHPTLEGPHAPLAESGWSKFLVAAATDQRRRLGVMVWFSGMFPERKTGPKGGTPGRDPAVDVACRAVNLLVDRIMVARKAKPDAGPSLRARTELAVRALRFAGRLRRTTPSAVAAVLQRKKGLHPALLNSTLLKYLDHFAVRRFPFSVFRNRDGS